MSGGAVVKQPPWKQTEWSLGGATEHFAASPDPSSRRRDLLRAAGAEGRPNS
jgi:hypothetical protein